MLTRESVRTRGDLMLNTRIPAAERIWVSTTGTTGGALKVCYTRDVMRRNWAFRMQQFAWAGIHPLSPRITAFGSRIVPSSQKGKPFWVENRCENQILLSIYHLSPAAASDYMEFLSAHSNSVLEGFPSALAVLAQFVRERAQPIPMRAVFTDGEPLLEPIRRTIEAAFQSKVFNTYGNTELCGLLQQCEHEGMHLNPDYAFLEIVDEEGREVKRGETGYLVWTGFVNDCMPLLRYRIGDQGSWMVSQDCPCGRKWPLVDPGVSRDSDVLHAADGRILSPRAVNQALKGAATFSFCQFVQRWQGHVLVRAVGSGERAQKELSAVRARIALLLGAGTTVEAELATGPIVTNGGKTPLVIQDGRR